MGRAPHKLTCITYGDIAGWTGLALQTIRGYASDGQFDAHNLESVLQWVNRRRVAAGLPLIGDPEENSETPLDTRENGNASQKPYIYSPNSPGYDPLTGKFL